MVVGLPWSARPPKNATKATLISRWGNQILIFLYASQKMLQDSWSQEGCHLVDMDGSYLQKSKAHWGRQHCTTSANTNWTPCEGLVPRLLVHWTEFGSGNTVWLRFICFPVGELIDRWPKKCIKCSKHSEGRKSWVIANEGVITFQTADSKLAIGQGNILSSSCKAIQLTHCLLCVLLWVLFFVCVEAEGAW